MCKNRKCIQSTQYQLTYHTLSSDFLMKQKCAKINDTYLLKKKYINGIKIMICFVWVVWRF